MNSTQGKLEGAYIWGGGGVEFITGCNFWLTGRWAYKRGGVGEGLIRGSLQYFIFSFVSQWTDF